MRLLRPQTALRRLEYTLIFLTFIAMSGVIGFRLIEGWSWLDSIYMVVMTMATVGYREVHQLSDTGRIFNVFLMIFGVGSVFFAIGTFTQTLLEFELHNLFGKRKMQREIESLKGHYIICGAGRVGQSAARELARKPVPFVVIEAKADRLHQDPPEWLVLEGDATQEKVLRQAQIDHAAGLVAATTTDATNIYIVLTARALNPKLKIIARASEEDAAKHLKTAGADSVISPYTFAGHRVAQSFLRPNVVDFLDIAVSSEIHDEMVIEEILVSERSRLAGTTVGTSYIHRDMGIMILAIKRADGRPCFNPTATERIEAGDNLIVMGEAVKMPMLESTAAGKAT
ncbi:MAG TPA: potassium channel protein [Terriglobales bacterium]|nr:potassium channel protein [Terriglobales bacterium]